MRIVTAPNELNVRPKDVLCYLGGDVTCERDLQSEVINALLEMERDNPHEHLVIVNPRAADKYTEAELAAWRFHALNICDIFSMYFPDGKDQAICMYELGHGIARMMEKHPLSYWERLIISTEHDYIYRHDVVMQISLASALNLNAVIDMATPQKHAHEIIMAYTWATEDL